MMCHQNLLVWAWLDRYLTYIWMWWIERCTQRLHNALCSCSGCSIVVKILLKTIDVCILFKWMMCHQNLLVWAWLDRYLTYIWMWWIEICTQRLHNALCCCYECCIVVKILLKTIDVCILFKWMMCHQNLLVWAWLDRYLTYIWMWWIEICTQRLHNALCCCSGCSIVVKILL